jgi:hypothetical protein
MSRKSSLTEIAKAYEQVLEEMNIGIPSVGDSVLIKNALSPLKSGEEMANVAISADTNREKCPCEGDNCEEGEENIECEGEDCEPNQTENEKEEEEESQYSMHGGCSKNCKCPSCSRKSTEEDCEDSEDYDVASESNKDMAKSEIFKINKAAQGLMCVVQKSSKIEPWMLSKLVKASDYLCSVLGVLEYDNFEKEVQIPADDFSNDMHLVSKITNMLNGENRAVNEEVLKRVIFNLEILENK